MMFENIANIVSVPISLGGDNADNYVDNVVVNTKPDLESVVIYVNSKPHIEAKNEKVMFGPDVSFKNGKTYVRAYYLGSSTRIGEEGNIFTPELGYLDNHIRIVEYDHSGAETVIFNKTINFMNPVVEMLQEILNEMTSCSSLYSEECLLNHLKKIEKVKENKYCPIDGFTSITFEDDVTNKTVVFNFRDLHRFGGEVEMSGISYF